MLWLTVSVTLLGALALLLTLAYFVPVSLGSNVQARADPSGAWAVAWGLGVGPLALSVIAAAGVAPFVTVHLFGRQVLRLPLSRWLRRAQKNDAKTEVAPPRLSRAEHSLGRFLRALDPVDTVLSWWDKERVFEVRSLVVDLDYSFRDVAFTGRVLAALCVLSAVLPERWQVNHTPSWEAEDRVLLVSDARFRIWVGRLLFDLACFVLKQRSRMRQSAAPVSE
jgi:hypothetical protein